MEEVPGSEESLVALDEQPALTGQNEEGLLIRLGVVNAALAGLEDGHIDPELRELDRRLAVLVGEPTRRALVSEENHSASRTLTTNQPSVTGASPEPTSSSLASFTQQILAVQATAVWYGPVFVKTLRATACRVTSPRWMHAQRPRRSGTGSTSPRLSYCSGRCGIPSAQAFRSTSTRTTCRSSGGFLTNRLVRRRSRPN